MVTKKQGNFSFITFNAFFYQFLHQVRGSSHHPSAWKNNIIEWENKSIKQEWRLGIESKQGSKNLLK